MSWLFLLSGCELYLGPWGAWAFHGEGEATAIGAEDLPVGLDDGLAVTRSEADSLVPGWVNSVTVDGELLLATHSSDVLVLWDLDGWVRHTVSDVALDVSERWDALVQTRLVVDSVSGGLVVLHPVAGTVRVHRESAGTWSWSDLSVERWDDTTDIAHTVAGDALAWVTNWDELQVYEGGERVTPAILIDSPEDLLHGADGRLVQVGYRWEDGQRYVVWDGCRLPVEVRGHVGLVPGATGVELFHADAFDRMSLYPLLDDCSLGEARGSWQTPYARGESEPVRFGEALIWAVPVDQDPVYANPDERDEYWELEVADSRWQYRHLE